MNIEEERSVDVPTAELAEMCFIPSVAKTFSIRYLCFKERKWANTLASNTIDY